MMTGSDEADLYILLHLAGSPPLPGLALCFCLGTPSVPRMAAIRALTRVLLGFLPGAEVSVAEPNESLSRELIEESRGLAVTLAKPQDEAGGQIGHSTICAPRLGTHGWLLFVHQLPKYKTLDGHF